jgi:hypothetical protein
VQTGARDTFKVIYSSKIAKNTSEKGIEKRKKKYQTISRIIFESAIKKFAVMVFDFGRSND